MMDINRTTAPLQHQRRGDVLRGSSIVTVCMCVCLVNPLAATLCSSMFSSLARVRTVRFRGLYAMGSNMLHKPKIRLYGAAR